MFLRLFHVLFCDFLCFLICFVTMGWFSKRWANLQTRAKLSSPQNTANTVSKRYSKLTISVICDDFCGFNQTFWCSFVGVFLIETHKNIFFRKCFQMVFVLQDFYILRNIMLFMMSCIRCFKIFTLIFL